MGHAKFAVRVAVDAKGCGSRWYRMGEPSHGKKKAQIILITPMCSHC